MREGVTVATESSQLADAMRVRYEVFVEEQDVPSDLERDEYDEQAAHFVAYEDGDPVGAARLRAISEDAVKIERVAVLPTHRGRGWGRRLVASVERFAAEHGFTDAELNAQQHAEAFYERLGYERVSDVFYEAGFPHVKMVKRLDADET